VDEIVDSGSSAEEKRELIERAINKFNKEQPARFGKLRLTDFTKKIKSDFFFPFFRK